VHIASWHQYHFVWHKNTQKKLLIFAIWPFFAIKRRKLSTWSNFALVKTLSFLSQSAHIVLEIILIDLSFRVAVSSHDSFVQRRITQYHFLIVLHLICLWQNCKILPYTLRSQLINRISFTLTQLSTSLSKLPTLDWSSISISWHLAYFVNLQAILSDVVVIGLLSCL